MRLRLPFWPALKTMQLSLGTNVKSGVLHTTSDYYYFGWRTVFLRTVFRLSRNLRATSYSC